MAQTAQQADAEFRPTLNHNLLTTIFQTGSTADKVERALQSTINKQDTTDFQLLIYHTTTRTLRVVLKSWRFLPGAGGEYKGHPIDKIDYGYNANQAIREKYNDPESLEYQIKRCLTDEFKKDDGAKLKAQTLQGIIAGATKMYLVLMHRINAIEKGGETVELGPEPEATTATYEAVLGNVSPPNTESMTPRQTVAQFASENQLTLSSFVQTAEPANSTDQTPAPRGPGNFDHGVAIKWNNEEDYSVEQVLRENPSMTWGVVTAQHNARFEGTMFYAGKKGPIRRGKRTLPAVQKRFKKFRQEMQHRVNNGQPRQNTASDVEPDEEPNLEYDEASVEENRGVEEELDEAEVPEAFSDEDDSPGADHDAAGDLDELERRVDEGTV